MKRRFQFYRNGSGPWYIKAPNGDYLDNGGAGYADLDECEKAIRKYREEQKVKQGGRRR